jgi:hypothetical protein
MMIQSKDAAHGVVNPALANQLAFYAERQSALQNSKAGPVERVHDA